MLPDGGLGRKRTRHPKRVSAQAGNCLKTAKIREILEFS